MKQYPSIPSSNGTSFREYPHMHIFEKLDGSNLRFEWNGKGGWSKFGSRTQLICPETPIYGPAIPLFLKEIGPFIRKKWPKAKTLTAFCEWLGPNSFAGVHTDPIEDMQLFLIDLTEDKKGFIPAGGFVSAFVGQIPTPDYYGQHNWTRGFVQRIHDQDFAPMAKDIEGVVGKCKTSPTVTHMAKAKTNWWKEKIKSLYTEKEAEAMLLS